MWQKEEEKLTMVLVVIWVVVAAFCLLDWMKWKNWSSVLRPVRFLVILTGGGIGICLGFCRGNERGRGGVSFLWEQWVVD